jgi:hypothetical protein
MVISRTFALVAVCVVVLAAEEKGESQSIDPVSVYYPLFEYRTHSRDQETGLLVLRGVLANGSASIYMIPPLIQRGGVEALGSSTARYVVKFEPVWNQKLQEIVAQRVGMPRPMSVEGITFAIPELGFVVSVRAPRLVPGEQFTVPFYVEPDRIKLAYERLVNQDLAVRVTYRFGSVAGAEGKVVLTRDEFVKGIPTSDTPGDPGSLYRYRDIEERLMEVKNNAAVSQWSEFQLIPLQQMTMDDVLSEWFEEVPSAGVDDGGGSEGQSRRLKSHQGLDPWRKLSRVFDERVFRLKSDPGPAREIMRFFYQRPKGEYTQSFRVGFKPAEFPAELQWRAVRSRALSIRAPCGQPSSGVTLQEHIQVNQKLELMLAGSLGSPETELVAQVDIAGVAHPLVSMSSGMEGGKSWSTVARRAGIPRLAVSGPACREGVGLTMKMVIYE